MSTARDRIKSALRKIHVLGKGQTLDPDEANDALESLNSMLSSWSVEGGYIFTETRETFNLGTAPSYSIGDGADFNTSKPLKITSMYATNGGIDNPVLQVSGTDYAHINTKDTATTYPNFFYFDNASPVARLYFYPKPVGGTVTISSYKALTGFPDLDTDFELPSEYRAAIDYNLAIWLSGEYEREPSRSVLRIANKTKRNVLKQNGANSYITSKTDIPAGKRGTYNIYEGQH